MDRIAEQGTSIKRKNIAVLGGILLLMGFFYWLTIHRITESSEQGAALRDAASKAAEHTHEPAHNGEGQLDLSAPIDLPQQVMPEEPLNDLPMPGTPGSE